jgi:hypothetical protein
VPSKDFSTNLLECRATRDPISCLHISSLYQRSRLTLTFGSSRLNATYKSIPLEYQVSGSWDLAPCVLCDQRSMEWTSAFEVLYLKYLFLESSRVPSIWTMGSTVMCPLLINGEDLLHSSELRGFHLPHTSFLSNAKLENSRGPLSTAHPR